MARMEATGGVGKTAVDRFVEVQDRFADSPAVGTYRELIPASGPGPGQQYAFEVDLDRCSGCKACMAACHSENGLDEDELWRSVGMLRGGDASEPFLQHITTACHHCADPACLLGCPTLAYEKDPVTGVVRHLDDQCFGCQYCILKCPYDVPKYSARRGIVRKCDLCVNRLRAGEAPACVRACPTDAIRVTLVDREEVRRRPDRFVAIPDAPDSGYTHPSTRYVTRRTLPKDAVSADRARIEPEHAHFPLVVMLVLSQISVGMISLASVGLFEGFGRPSYLTALFAGLIFGGAGLTASLFHLGRPRYFFRAVLGWRTSWLSREILAFSFYMTAGVLWAFTEWTSAGAGTPLDGFRGGFAAATVIGGWLGVFCSIMVYWDTHRPFWARPSTALRFVGTVMGSGAAAVLAAVGMRGLFFGGGLDFRDVEVARGWIGLLLVVTILKLGGETAVLRHLKDPDSTSLKKTALLMARRMRRVTTGRYLFGALGGIGGPLAVMAAGGPSFAAAAALGAFILVLVGEILERYLFFRAVVPLRMP